MLLDYVGDKREIKWGCDPLELNEKLSKWKFFGIFKTLIPPLREHLFRTSHYIFSAHADCNFFSRVKIVFSSCLFVCLFPLVDDGSLERLSRACKCNPQMSFVCSIFHHKLKNTQSVIIIIFRRSLLQFTFYSLIAMTNTTALFFC